MEYRKLGRSGLEISALSFGSWLTFGKQIGMDVAESLLVKACDSGINFFDNAEIYARGESERVMGEIIHKMAWPRSSYLVSSKVYFGYEENRPNQRGLSRKHIVEGCEAALRRLKVDYIDLYFCHRPDKHSPIAETVLAMDHLVRQGKILYWGTSEWSAAEIMQAHLEAARHHCVAPVMEQPQYNLFERKKMEEEYLHLFRYEGLGTTIWSPLASGLLSGKYLDGFPDDTRLSIKGMEWLKERNLTPEKLELVRQLSQLAAEAGLSLPRLAIAWCLSNKNVSTVILGASKPAQLDENLLAIADGATLTTDVLERIDFILNNRPLQPEY